MLQKVSSREANELNGKEQLSGLTSQGSGYILAVNSNYSLNSCLCLLLALMKAFLPFSSGTPAQPTFSHESSRSELWQPPFVHLSR